MKIFLLTPVYETTTGKSASTPVVHYFAKEWVKQGHEVTVFHVDPKYPKPFYWIAKRFQHKLIAIFSQSIPIECPKDYKKTTDGVNIIGVTYTKIVPHSRISNFAKMKILSAISNECNRTGLPDVFIGHWYTPQLDILPVLKQKFKKPTCLVFHNNDFCLDKVFGGDLKKLLSHIDILGFRNESARDVFETKYGNVTKSFIAYSGVSEPFLKAGEFHNPDFGHGVKNFLFVGLLLKRKYPAEILTALGTSFDEQEQFTLTYVGDGECRKEIAEVHAKINNRCKVNLTGRIPRESVIKYLKENQVFVMISKEEIFGLVYLEAMALGLIPIGSRGEGIDGIIVDGVNGFLCEAGNTSELSSIILKMKAMSPCELQRISYNARKTAIEYSDYNVAKKYIGYIKDNI